jgi:glycerate dehydrogenase
MKTVVLDRGAMGRDLDFEMLGEFGSYELYDATAAEKVVERCIDADVIILNKVVLDSKILNELNNLKLICVFATGFDNVDVAAAKARNVAVCNVPAYSTDSVMLTAVATVLSLVTHLVEYRNFVADGSYTEAGKANCLEPVYHEASGRVFGLVGYGNIGRAIGKVASALGYKVIVNKRTPVDDAEVVDIDTLCEQSDVIVLCCPLTEQTRGLISRERIAKMKRGVILVNSARGAIVDEQAVADAVINGTIGGFGCDVYSTEPFDKKHPYDSIKSLNNVVLTPHFAWAAYESRVRCLNVVYNNIKSFLDGEILNRVDKRL